MTVSEVIGWAILGLVAGAIARMLHPSPDPMNWVWTMLLGIGGAIVGGYVGQMLGINTDRGLTSWIAAVVGVIVLLALYHLATAPRVSTVGGTATNADYKQAVYDDLSRGPNG
jgi:uncharacterized membrane protein YeaQ/YmgE (transglycosylase-associated protein family)